MKTRNSKHIVYETYKEILQGKDSLFIKSTNIVNRKGQLSTIQIMKRGLSSFEDKRYYLSKTESVSYGHPQSKQTASVSVMSEENESMYNESDVETDFSDLEQESTDISHTSSENEISVSDNSEDDEESSFWISLKENVWRKYYNFI